jgi:predicted secreted acid phosphatase
LGDNLNDFSNVFENRGDDWGVSIVNNYKNQLGKRFIMFPNPMYGEWEKNIYGHKRNLTEKEKFKLRRKALKTY